jgi:hypothetical protein
VLDLDRALRFARAACGALPEHLRVEHVGEFRVQSARKQRLVLEDQRLRVELLARAVGRAVLLAAAALDARERVEHLLPLDVGHRLESHLLLLEIEVRDGRQARRAQVHRQRRQHEMEVLRVRDEHQEPEDHDRVDPPVPTRAARPRSHLNASRKVIIRVRMKNPMSTDSPDTWSPSAAGRTIARRTRSPLIPITATERHERQRAEVEPPRGGEVGDAEAGEELDACVEGEGREAPVDAQVGEADERAFRNRARLEDDFGDKTQEPAPRLVVPDLDVVPGAQDEPRARPHLRREGGGEPEDKDAEDPGLGGVH